MGRIQGTARESIRGSPLQLLGTCILAYFAIRFVQIVLGPILPVVLEEFRVSHGAAGLVFTCMWVAYALAQLPSGVFADRFGERRIVLGSLALCLLAALGIALAPTFVLFGLFVAVLGAAAGSYYNPATALLARSFDRVGGSIGGHRIGGQLAGVIAPTLAAILLVRVGWRPTVALGAVLAAVVFVTVTAAVARSPPVRPDASLRELFAPEELAAVLAKPHTRVTTWMMTLIEFVVLATMAFLPTLLVEHNGFSLAAANVLFAAFFGLSAILQPLSGLLSDRVGRDLTALGHLTIGAVGFGLLSSGATGVIAAGAVLLAAVTLGCTPIMQSRMLDGLSPAQRGTGFGLFRTIYLLIGATGTTAVGVLADWSGWTVAFGLLTACIGTVLVTTLIISTRSRMMGT